ncbi:hypothetical protein ACN47E_005164 [Coniothyrium glycines]
MPPTLHPHLKRGLDFDGLHVDSGDLLETLPPELLDQSHQEAKRRRIEDIAARYLLRGNVPVILSAGLKGPFDDGWKNPWASSSRPQYRGSIPGKNTEDNINEIETQSRVRSTRERKDRTKGKTTKIPSPEASRATRRDMNLSQQDCTLEVIDAPPATAPSLEEEIASAGTVFYSADSETCVRIRSRLSNPFWLRRPASQEPGNMGASINTNPDLSPTHYRPRQPQDHSKPGQALRIARPTKSLPRYIIPENSELSEAWNPGASASPIIASAVDNSTHERHMSTGTMNAESIDIEYNAGTSCRQSQTASLATFGIQASKTRLDRPIDTPVYDALRDADVMAVASPTIDILAAQCLAAHSVKKVSMMSPKHTSMAPPCPTRTTDLASDRVARMQANGHKPKLRPRVVNFDSSPPSVKEAIATDQPSPKTTIHIDEIEQPKDNISMSDLSRQAGVKEGTAEIPQAPCHSDELSHASTISTQAAMVLAQLQFQDSSFVTTSPDARRPWSQISQATPRMVLPIPSPGLTPLPGFNNRRDKPVMQENLLQQPQMSTQDLFGAASPFAFSTVKKKPEASQQRSSLQVTSRAGNDAGTITERVPLKDKNVPTAFWASILDKASQSSQDLLIGKSKQQVSDVELPQLDFGTSLDDFGSNGEVHFTDRFLHDVAHT